MIVGVVLANRERHGFSVTLGEVGALVATHFDVLSAAFVQQRVVFKYEGAGAAHHVVTQQITPIFSDVAVLERLQRVGAALFLGFEQTLVAGEVALDHAQRAAGQYLVFGQEQPELIGKIDVVLVVRRRRQQHHARLAGAQVFENRPIALAVAVAQIVRLVDQHQMIGA